MLSLILTIASPVPSYHPQCVCQLMVRCYHHACDEQENEEEVDLDLKIQILLASREKAFKAVEANITAAQKCQKETYDRKHQPQVLLEGTEVLLENTHQKQR